MCCIYLTSRSDRVSYPAKASSICNFLTNSLKLRLNVEYSLRSCLVVIPKNINLRLICDKYSTIYVHQDLHCFCFWVVNLGIAELTYHLKEFWVVISFRDRKFDEKGVWQWQLIETDVGMFAWFVDRDGKEGVWFG